MGSQGYQSDHQGPALLLFGPQAPSFSNRSLSELKSALQDQQWALDTISELSATWDIASTTIPTLRSIPGKQLLSYLQIWLRNDPPEQDVGDLPNIILAPLTVLTQLTQYQRYLERNYGHALDPHAALVLDTNATALGFCMGLLTAFAIAGASTTQDLHQYAAAAVRLAMLVGAVVDVADKAHANGPSESLATAWQTQEQGAELKSILDQSPDDAYVSVWYDERRATVTVSKRTAPGLLQELRQAGITAAPTGLRGRFHWEQHVGTVDALVHLCDTQPGLSFPDVGKLVLPTCTNAGNGEPVRHGRLHELALRAMLVQQCDWYGTVSTVVRDMAGSEGRLISISTGPARCIPPSLIPKLGSRVKQFGSLEKDLPRELTANVTNLFGSDDLGSYTQFTSTEDVSQNLHNGSGSQNDDLANSRDIAIVGMSIKVAGADDLDEFSTILRSGESQHQEVPVDRVPFGAKDSDGQKWYGNFMRDVDAFDHKFFRKSPRESAAMDPQQRLILQAAYQAVEQSGYFNSAASAKRDKHIGVYLAACATDYQYNASCHPAGAFTVMGLLRASIAGRVSHYFGWTGPSMTFDTACSGSAVAIHSAVRALQSGECSAALCGGVNVIANEIWFHNLAGASFLSSTGQCKPFDEGADGYCRGEGIACVLLKPMAAALEDGDRIFGQIAGVAVHQNDNSTPLFVPNSPSMSRLFKNVIHQARLQPQDISLVEAHGTGTPVGDPVEYQSIRTALAGPIRRKPLSIGSVKGFVGHTEGTSGVVSLIKVILMMQEGFIPPQASYSKMSHRVNALASDMIRVPTSLQPWMDEYKAALINNYGASGSIAAMIVTQAPPRLQRDSVRMPGRSTFPFWISGFDGRSIAAYCAKLAAFIEEKAGKISLDDLSFNLNRQANHTLSRALLFRCSTIVDLLQQLSPVAALQHIEVKPARPLILCFGGQISTSIGLDRRVYETVPLFRYHLDQCGAIAQSLGLESIYPGIFSKAPVADIVHLQTMLFALQYACARCWMDCGVRVEAVVGHSFGEIAALCVSDVLELRDAIKLVAGRAKVVKDLWGPDRGVMIAVDGELELVEQLLEQSNRVRIGGSPASIASLAMSSVADTLSRGAIYASIKSKKLDVTNAFHSTLVEPLLPNLEQVGTGLNFHKPTIRLERATDLSSTGQPFTHKFVADHMPRDYPSAIWLEAGSASTITSMARRAVSLTDDQGIEEGLHAAREHAPLLLPPYQFEKTGHWLELKTPLPVQEAKRDDPSLEKRRARFRINTESERYTALVAGHVAYTMAIEALFSLQESTSSMKNQNLHPVIRDMRNDAPLCVNTAQSAWLELHADKNPSHQSWTWRIVTTTAGKQPDSRNTSEYTVCVQGRLELRSPNEAAEFARYERLVTHKQCVSVLDDDAGAIDILQGRNVYRSLSDVVDYGDLYRGVRRVIGQEAECAGVTWLDDVPVVDSFSQVAGIWVNCMTEREPGGSDIFLATGCEMIMRSPKFTREDRLCQPGKVWHVWARHHRESDRAFLTDVFVFDAVDGRLTEVMLGIRYTRIPRLSMSRLLTGAGNSSSDLSATGLNAVERPQPPLRPSLITDHQKEAEAKGTTRSSRQGLSQKVRDVVASVSGVEAIEIQDDSALADLGIDSLAGSELGREIESVFHCKVNAAELLFEANSFREFVACISRAIYGPDDHATLDRAVEDEDNLSSNGGGMFSDDSHAISTPITTDSSSINGMTGDDATIKTAIAKTNSLLDILTAFAQVKFSTDQRIRDNRVDDTDAVIVSRSTRLCVTLVTEALEKLGCPLRTAAVGQVLERVSHQPHFLEKDARLIDTDGSRIMRTAIPVPSKTSEALFQEILQANDQWIIAHKLAYRAGKSLANVLSGQKDGIQALFGSPEGRDLVRRLYCDLPFNRLFYEQMRDVIRHLTEKLPPDFQGPLRILEMGTGTGGTTHILAPFLASLRIPVEYTVTDLSPSMVAQLRRTFGARYGFMRFAVHDIEKPPADPLSGTQHIVIASNAVHATADLTAAASNIRKALRPDGMLLLTEMTESLPFVDLVFGLLEDWWRFADDRVHAIVPAEHWEARLRDAGFGHVDWSDGRLSENRIQRVIMASASSPSTERLDIPNISLPDVAVHDDSVATREAEAEKYVTQYSADFMMPTPAPCDDLKTDSIQKYDHNSGAVVVITGATGSLGSHLVARFAEDPTVNTVVCLNRRTNSDASASQRQQAALLSRGITLSPDASSKLHVFATDTSQPHLGLPPTDYAWLVSHGTHILHNAWPMSASRPLRAFEPQFQSLRRLLDLAADISIRTAHRLEPRRVCFQLISSIGVVGLHPTLGSPMIPEERVHMSSVLPVGYCEAKWVCERLLDETLHRHPDQFRAMVVRPGQISGSSANGMWNTAEHFAFLVRSAQSLRAFPAFNGSLQWVPVDGVAEAVADLALNGEADGPVYHVDNPVGQPWEDMVPVLAEELGIPKGNIVPFAEWIRKVRRSPLAAETENPALRLVEFLDRHFERMSCGGIILDTAKAVEHSPTLAAQGPVPTEVARRYIRAWKAEGFLSL
ncbi:hypothetical protein F4677DRAFT_452639 [Hypoxylon crocopeplum]|nr:hypothetical protein F4677DRAFT_452639 [Hypoxylon crocopeplum]